MKLALMTALLTAVFGAPAHAQPDAVATLSDGEIRKIDPDTRKITIRHGPISNLGMPPMTMVFQVDDPALLKNVKAGDTVRFTAEKNDGRYIVRQLQKKP